MAGLAPNLFSSGAVERRADAPHLPLEALFLQRLAQRQRDPLEVRRLLDVVEGAALHRRDRRGDVPVAREDDHRHVRGERADLAQGHQAALARHLQVEEHRVRGDGAKDLERLHPVRRLAGRVPLELERVADHRPQVGLVVDDQDPFHRLFSHPLTLSPRRRDRNRRRLILRPRQQRQLHPEGRPLPRLGLDLDPAVVLLDNTMNDREPEAHPAADILRREERLEQPPARLRGHADPGVPHRDAGGAALVGGGSRHALQPQGQGAALRHRIAGVVGQVQQQLLQARRVPEDPHRLAGRLDLEAHALAERLAEHRRLPRQQRGQVDGARLEQPGAAEEDQPLDQVAGAIERHLHLAGVLQHELVLRRALLQDVHGALERREDVLEVVGDPLAERAHRLHLLGLAQPLREPLLLALPLGDVAGHVREGRGQPADLVVRHAGQLPDVAAGAEGAHRLGQLLERPGHAPREEEPRPGAEQQDDEHQPQAAQRPASRVRAAAARGRAWSSRSRCTSRRARPSGSARYGSCPDAGRLRSRTGQNESTTPGSWWLRQPLCAPRRCTRAISRAVEQRSRRLQRGAPARRRDGHALQREDRRREDVPAIDHPLKGFPDQLLVLGVDRDLGAGGQQPGEAPAPIDEGGFQPLLLDVQEIRGEDRGDRQQQQRQADEDPAAEAARDA